MNSFFKPHPGTIPVKQRRKAILLNGFLCGAFYIGFLLLMEALGLVQYTQLRVVNYVVLYLVTFFQVKHWINQYGTFVPFLQVLSVTLITGMWSFILFTLFLDIYIQYDPVLAELFSQRTRGFAGDWPATVILFEGAAVSIIEAYINMQFFRRYEEGEVKPTKKPEDKATFKGQAKMRGL